jgi:hypothetical protein
MENILSELFRMFWKMLWSNVFKDLIKTTYDMIKRRNFSNRRIRPVKQEE